jgi:nucleotidyltransferase/DNA polymerase involved in DNA repair
VIGCALIPRFSLTVALGSRRKLLGRPVAVAPEPGRPQVVGEASSAAEAFGVRAGVGLAEALARCPELVLLPPDPERADAAWEEALAALEGMGAAVEPARPGEAFFALEGLHGVWGGVEGALRRARCQLGPVARLGAGPTRLCAGAAALGSPPRRRRSDRPPSGAAIRGGFVVVPEGAVRAFLAPLPVVLLADRLEDEWARATLPPTLERLGIRTLGELAELPDDAVADRFGERGLVALRMARGVERGLRPRHPRPDLVQELELPEAASGPQLERALELLVDRLLADPRRGGRGLRRLRLFTRLASGGGWRADAVLRSASSNRIRIRLALAPKLGELPAPAAALGLRALALGPPEGEQPSLARDERERRRERLGEAVRQVRSAAGADAVLRVLDVDPGSRVPERRVTLTPYPEVDG